MTIGGNMQKSTSKKNKRYVIFNRYPDKPMELIATIRRRGEKIYIVKNWNGSIVELDSRYSVRCI